MGSLELPFLELPFFRTSVFRASVFRAPDRWCQQTEASWEVGENHEQGHSYFLLNLLVEVKLVEEATHFHYVDGLRHRAGMRIGPSSLQCVLYLFFRSTR